MLKQIIFFIIISFNIIEARRGPNVLKKILIV